MRFKKMLATTVLVATMSCGQAMLPASAVTVPEEVSVPSPVQEDVDLQALEAEVTTIFERYLQQDSEGRWSVVHSIFSFFGKSKTLISTS